MPVIVEESGYNRPVMFDPASHEPIGPYAVFYRDKESGRAGYSFQSAKTRNEAARIWLELVSQGFYVLDIARLLKVTITLEGEEGAGKEEPTNGRSCHVALSPDGRIVGAILDSFKFRDMVNSRCMAWLDQGLTVEKRPLSSVISAFPEDRIELLKRG